MDIHEIRKMVNAALCEICHKNEILEKHCTHYQVSPLEKLNDYLMKPLDSKYLCLNCSNNMNDKFKEEVGEKIPMVNELPSYFIFDYFLYNNVFWEHTKEVWS